MQARGLAPLRPLTCVLLPQRPIRALQRAELLERRGRVQTRPQLLEIVWEAQPDIQTRTVDMHVQRLRSKLGDSGRFIETVRGFGYRFKGGERGVRAK